MDRNKINQNNMREKPILILLEGLDCSGKKTIARLLHEKLIAEGISAKINIGALTFSSYKFISSFVSLHKCPNIIRSLVYSFDGYRKYLWYKNFNEKIVIQISSPLRNWAYAFVHKKYIRIMMICFIKKHLTSYDVVWYLTVPYEIRIQRHKFQVNKKENSDSLKKRFQSKEVFDQIEQKLKKILSMYGIERVFDTNRCNCDKIVNYMIDYILREYLREYRDTLCIPNELESKYLNKAGEI